jgi:Peptidase family M23
MHEKAYYRNNTIFCRFCFTSQTSYIESYMKNMFVVIRSNAFILHVFGVVSLLVVSGCAFCQRAVDVNYDQDAQGNYTFSYTNKAFCSYILQINFSTLQNAISDHPLPLVTEVRPGSGKLLRLSKEKAAEPIQLKYGFTSYKGCLHPMVDTGFVYLLPIAPGKETQVYEIRNNSKTTPDGRQLKDWYAIRMRMKTGDTIYASRRGVVTEVNVSSGQNDAGVSGPDADNYIEIFHKDCSFGEYGIIKKDGSFVKPGQVVEAGQAIGLVGGDKFGRGSEARLSVTYNQLEDDGQKNEAVGKNGVRQMVFSVYVPIHFWTKYNGKGMLKHGATYTSEHPAKLLNQESNVPAGPLKKKKTTSKGH